MNLSSALEQQPCYLVNNITRGSQEQCRFILDNNCLEKEATFDYVYLVYCEFGEDLRYLSMILLAFLVIILFLALSAIADEFLCPSLLSVAKNLKMSDSLAGVTLLAFGNGCPDIFASIAAASGDRSELIVGELLGAGIFCTSIVAGLIFIHSDFKLATRPILRDTTFYLLAVYLVWYYCHIGQVTFYGSLFFILIYVIYLIVALSGQAIHSRFLGNYAISEIQTLQRCHDEEKSHNENWYKWREESLRRRRQLTLISMKKDLDTHSLQSKIVHHKNGSTTIHIGSDSFSSSSQQLSRTLPLELELYSRKEKPKLGKLNEAYVDDEDDFKSSHFQKDSQVTETYQEQTQTKSSKINTKEEYLRQQFEKQQEKPRKVSIQKYNSLDLDPIEDFFTHASPINWQMWNERSLINKVISIIRAPLLFAAIITIPVVDQDKKNQNWCRLLNSLHCITIPLTFSLVLGSDLDMLFLFGLPLPLLALLPGIGFAILVIKTSVAQEAPKYHPIFAYLGFSMSILWIYTLASEIIGLLKTVGIIFSMTDTAIGLGILAWGNSLGDIVANISLVEAGYPRMALGASIGAPLLNLLLGFGLSFTLSMKPGEFSEIEYSPTITLLCSTLALILLSIMLSTLIRPERSRKGFGFFLIACYGVYFTLAICLEYNIIKI